MKFDEIIYLPILLIVFYILYISSFKIPVILLFAGFFILIKGSDFFINGAVGISSKLGISEHTIGLTIVAFGTSLPELAVSSLASYQKHASTAWGNVIGSNITNILLILGLAMLFSTIKPSRFAFKDAISMLAVSFLTIFLAFDGKLNFYDGLILLAFYVYFLYTLRGRGLEGEEIKGKAKGAILFLILGFFGIAFGGEAVVKGAVGIAHSLGIAEATVAGSIVAFGTSLPELATTVMAAIKKHYGIAVGNVIGSNVVNLALVLGISSMLANISLNLMTPMIFFFFLASFLILVILKEKWLSKIVSISFLILYAIFIATIYIF